MSSKNGIWYKKYGSGRPLIFLHGLPLDQRVWNFHKYVFDGFSSYFVDLPGMGKSKDVAVKNTSMKAISGILIDFIRDLELKDSILLGHSMGGYIVLDLALRFPDFVSGLILVSTKAAPDSQSKKIGRLKFSKEIMEGKYDQYLNDQLGSCCKLSSVYFADIKNIIAQNITPNIVPILKILAHRHSYVPDLHKIKKPCHIIVGSGDKIMKIESLKMHKLIRGSSFEEIKYANHMVFLDQPRVFKNSVSHFLRNLT